MSQKVCLLMFSIHFYGSPSSEKGPRPYRCGIPCRRWVSNRSFLPDARHPFLRADGKVGFWVVVSLALLIIFSGAVIGYWYIGTGDQRSSFVIAPDGNEARPEPQRYKIEKPAQAPAQSVEGEASLDSGTPETPKELSVLPVSDGIDWMELPETDRPVDPHLLPVREADEKPSDAVPSGEVIFEEKPVEAKNQEMPKASAQPDNTVTDHAPSEPNKPKEVSIEKTEASPPGKGSVGKRFFIQRGLANVRNQPSMKSKVLFQVPNGSSVTVTDKRKGWYRVKTDNGRLGWVYHSVLAGSPVPRKDLQAAVLKLKAIRVEPPANQTGKVFFELSAPYVPEIVILEDDASRIVCDFVNARLARHIGRRIAVNNSIIQTIRVGLHQRPQAKVRVVLDLAPGRRYEAKQVSLEGADCFVLEITAVGDP